MNNHCNGNTCVCKPNSLYFVFHTLSTRRKKVNKTKYILTVEYGDPNSNLPLRTSIGIFEDQEEAEKFREETYEGSNFICTVYPFNVLGE